ncbi:hypothetical protein [Chryseobacterium turcicum]|uniref:Bacteriocin n=1 Tax=Chryseobacterium turcicum TaxID=2898076 RepID=A0A9Q3YUX7_9FLAO|nr:hypothetical protein [Chryseobacterium turcicum]MCD1116861.1 hypothetical protein [Chryseobacterium turcicum]
MTNNILKNAKKLKQADLKNIVGGVKGGNPDLSLCGCDCAGTVTGPEYCPQYFGCLQVYTCKDVY